MMRSQLYLPIDSAILPTLASGQWVELSGVMLTARDAALKKIRALVDEDKPLPVDLKQQLIYFVGPTPAAPGQPIGSAGPTTSRRMETYMPMLLAAGVKAMMGKGPLSAAVAEQFREHKAVYLSAAGGAGAFYGSKIRQANVVAYPELGPEAIYSLKAESFPAIVALDLHGGNLFLQGPERFYKE